MNPQEVGRPAEQVQYVAAVASTFQAQQTIIGSVVLRQNVTLRSARAGRVTDCPWEAGQTVTRGQVFLRLTGPQIEGPRRLISDDIRILMEQKAKAHADVDRLTTLATNGILTEKDKSLVAAQAVDREFTLKIDRAQEELQQLESSAQVVVPVDGQIIRLLVRDGTDVSEDELLAVLSVPADVAIEAAVFPKPGIRLHAGLTANVSLDLPTKPPRQLGVDYLLPSCDPHTGATIIGIIPKGDVGPLRLGQRVRIELLGDETETVIVPSSAVVSRAGKTYCVKRSGKSWQAVEVTVVGSNTAGDVYLSSGLRPGDDVMTEGAYAVIYRDFRELFTFED